MGGKCGGGGGGGVIEIDERWRLCRMSGPDGSPRLQMRQEFSQPPVQKLLFLPRIICALSSIELE